MIGASVALWAPRAPRAMDQASPGGRRAWPAASLRKAHQSPPFPPAPQHKGCAPVGQGKGVTRARPIGFLSKGCRGGCEKPVDSMGRHYANLDSTKRSGRFAILKPPRVGLFLPRVGPFFPRVDFLPIRPVPPSLLLLFQRRERGKEGGKRARGGIHGSEICNKSVSTGWSPDPRVFRGLRIEQSPMPTTTYSRLTPHPRIHGCFSLWSARGHA